MFLICQTLHILIHHQWQVIVLLTDFQTASSQIEHTNEALHNLVVSRLHGGYDVLGFLFIGCSHTELRLHDSRQCRCLGTLAHSVSCKEVQLLVANHRFAEATSLHFARYHRSKCLHILTARQGCGQQGLLDAACYLLREDVKGTAYRTLSHTVALLKDEFMQYDGFEGSLNLVRGEYECLVNKYAEKGRTQVVTHPMAIMTDDNPTKRSWRSSCLFYVATRRYLNRSLAHRMLFLTDQALLHLNVWAILGIALWGALAQKWVMLGAAVLAFILTVILRLCGAHRTFSRLREPISLWVVLPLELTVVWRQLATAVRYLFASPYDFTTHKQ